MGLNCDAGCAGLFLFDPSGRGIQATGFSIMPAYSLYRTDYPRCLSQPINMTQHPSTPAGLYPLCDLNLARRLERTEGAANASYVVARARLSPESGAEWIQVAGVYAMFDGPQSPLTQTFGLGLFDPVGDEEFHIIESFFRKRGAHVHHEVSPLIAPELVAQLTRRGYHPLEYSNVLVRPIAGGVVAGESATEVRLIEPHEAELWAQTATKGWRTESEELATFIREFGLIMARADGARCFLAFLDGQPVAAGALFIHGDVALFAGASTIPAARRRGAQLALLKARLDFAEAAGVELAMMVAQPGSASHRNSERQGFHVVYTRTKWEL